MVENISPPLRSLARPLEELRLDPENARLHPVRNIEAIKNSLARFGQQKPIVADASGLIIAGNGTYEAARALGWTHIAVSVTELTGKEAVAFALADNRTAELAEWDWQILTGHVKDLMTDPAIDLQKLGWEAFELEPLLKADWTPPEPGQDTGRELRNHQLVVGNEAWKVMHEAIELWRRRIGTQTASNGEAITGICRRFIQEVGAPLNEATTPQPAPSAAPAVSFPPEWSSASCAGCGIDVYSRTAVSGRVLCGVCREKEPAPAAA